LTRLVEILIAISLWASGHPSSWKSETRISKSETNLENAKSKAPNPKQTQSKTFQIRKIQNPEPEETRFEFGAHFVI